MPKFQVKLAFRIRQTHYFLRIKLAFFAKASKFLILFRKIGKQIASVFILYLNVLM